MEAAEIMGDLTERFVFVGGGIVDILISDPDSPPSRPTIDIDVIVSLASLADYYALGEAMRLHGFSEDGEGSVICRWRHTELIVDVMPTNEDVLGFGNRWYNSALQHSRRAVLPNGTIIAVIDPAHFLATKLEAFLSRGRGDMFASHDFEDIVAVINGLPDIVEQVSTAPAEVSQHLAHAFSSLVERPELRDAIEGQLASLRDSTQRTNVVAGRLFELANLHH